MSLTRLNRLFVSLTCFFLFFVFLLFSEQKALKMYPKYKGNMPDRRSYFLFYHYFLILDGGS